MRESTLVWGLLAACLINVFCLCGNEAQQIWKPLAPRDAGMAQQAGTYPMLVSRKPIGLAFSVVP